MPLQVLKKLRRNAGQMAYNSALYNWSLSGDTPDRMLVKPVDPWPGKAEAGRLVCGDACALEGDQLDIEEVAAQAYALENMSAETMHDFTWLRDLRALATVKGSGDGARRQARAMIEDWCRRYHKWDEFAWQTGVMGERLSMWIALYDFYGGTLDNDFQDMLFDSAIRQARHLSRALSRGGTGGVYGLDLLKGIKGLLYAGLAFEGYEPWVEQALDLLEREIQKQILGDGAHISRSPAQLLIALQIMLDIKTALTSGGYPLPEKIQHAIDRMGPALRFFRYADKHFALFNGTQKGDQDFVDCVLGQANVRGKGLQSLPCAGYERLSLGRTTVMFDSGQMPAYPYERQAHAAPLAFEMCYGKDRVLVSCGSHPSNPQWQDALRATAAHNTATLDHRNACEIREDGHIARRVKNTMPVREETKDAILVESMHDGYVTLNGFTHHRRLYLSDKGHNLRGEDLFTSHVPPAAAKDVVIRFHIHPRVNVSLVNDGQHALLRLPTGIGWRFKHTGGLLMLEDSVFLGQGSHPRKTKQLTIYGQISDIKAQIKWAFSREG